MQNLKRNIALTFRVSAKEREMIERRMAQASIRNLRAYLLKMAVDGRIIEVDLTHVRECSRLLGNIANNVNQIAKRANETGSIYAADIADIQERIAEFREHQNKTMKILSDILGGGLMPDLKLVTYSEIKTEGITWLWEPYIPYGKITLVQGDSGEGKSMMMAVIAAAVTRSDALPNGKTAAPADVIFQNAEDDPNDTTKVRLAVDIMLMAEEKGISEKTLKRAKSALGVISVSRGRHWYWEMPIEAEYTEAGQKEGQEGQAPVTSLSLLHV